MRSVLCEFLVNSEAAFLKFCGFVEIIIFLSVLGGFAPATAAAPLTIPLGKPVQHESLLLM
jgi:hypothetical protein